MKLKITLVVLLASVWIQNLTADPIHDAVNQNDFAKLKELVNNDKTLVSLRDSRQETPLSLAVNRGSLEMVTYLIENGADVNVRNNSSATPLYTAARRGRTEILKYLIDNGAVVDARCESGNTPLLAAVSSRKYDVVKYLLEKGANVAALDDSNDNALFKACWSNAGVDIVEKLVSYGVDVNFKSESNMNCINYLTWSGSTKVVNFLIEKGADVNLVEKEDGSNALINGVVFGRDEFIDCILPKVENINLQDKFNHRTALHWATIKGNKTVVEKLLEAGADPNMQDINGVTAAEYTVKYGLSELAKVYISNGSLDEAAMKNIPSSPLDNKTGKHEALVIYNGHSGWTVKTQKHLLIFDYCQQDRLHENSGILNGNISADDLKGKNVYVFASHDHGDHYNPENIFGWNTGKQKIKYIYGFDPAQSRVYRKKAYDGPAYTYISGDSQLQIDDLKISTLQSNDTGVGFLVEVDGVTIYHGGDHANLNNDVQDDYQKEIDFVASKTSKTDITFLPVTGCPVRWSAEYVMNGFFYAVGKLNPRYVFPMHGSDREYIYKNFKKAGLDRGFKNTIECAENKGDTFVCSCK